MNYKSLTLTNDEYRDKTGVANSDLMRMQISASELKFSQDAPRDLSKRGTFDFGTALHTALLEPEKFNNEVVVYSQTKTRDTKAFHEFAKNEEGLILLESEYNRLRFMVDGCKYHPAFDRLISAPSDKEGSIFVEDLDFDLWRKIRPDVDYVEHGKLALADVKSTANIADWRDTARWKNPLFTHGYGHTAAYYMDTASMYYEQSVDEYTFLILQKTIEMGRYPVAAITITRRDCESAGFFAEMYSNLDRYSLSLKSNKWDEVERFDNSILSLDDVTVGFEG